MLHESRDRLTELDKEIGDADHGINMDRGFQRLVGQLDGAPDLAGLFKTASLVLRLARPGRGRRRAGRRASGSRGPC